jgi:hypothetical protein
MSGCAEIHFTGAGKATGYGLDERSSVPSRDKIFLFSTASRPALGPTQLLSNRYRVFFPVE